MQSIMTSLPVSTHLDHLDWVDTEPWSPQLREQGLQSVHSNSVKLEKMKDHGTNLNKNTLS